MRECEKEKTKGRDKMSQRYESPCNCSYEYVLCGTLVEGYRVRNEMLKGEIEILIYKMHE